MPDISAVKRGQVTLDIISPLSQEEMGLRLFLISPKEPGPKKLAEQSLERQRRAARRNKPFTVAQETAEAISINAACVVGLEWYEVEVEDPEDPTKTKKEMGSIGGKQPEYSSEVAEELLGWDFILEQVADQLRDEQDFFAASKKA